MHTIRSAAVKLLFGTSIRGLSKTSAFPPVCDASFVRMSMRDWSDIGRCRRAEMWGDSVRGCGYVMGWGGGLVSGGGVGRSSKQAL